MQRTILRLSAAGLLAVAIAALPLSALGQSTNKPAATKKSGADKQAPGEKKQQNLPYKGALVAVDKAAKTITVSKRTFQITSETKFYRAEKAATLDDAVKGEYVTLSYRKTEDGKYLAHNVYYGGKAGKGSAKKTEKGEKAPQ